MNRNTFAFFVALLVHLVLFLALFLFVQSLQMQKIDLPKEKQVKISLKQFHPQKPKPKPRLKNDFKEIKKPKQNPLIPPPMPKGKQLKQINQKPLPRYNPKAKKRSSHLNKPKHQHKKLTKTKKVQKLPPLPKKPLLPYVKKGSKEENLTKTKPTKTDEKSSLYALLSQDHSDEEIQQKKQTRSLSKGVMQDIKELYGAEFGKLSPGQQRYILDNQEIMRRITQQVLNRVARVNLPSNLNVNAYNVIEFKLHPDGSMSDFRFIKKSGIFILDETTKETIEYAYGKYPRPSETTLIRYNVFYNLARY